MHREIKKRISQNFSKSSNTYDLHADIQKEMMHALLLQVKESTPQRILDIGGGTGTLAKLLADKFPRSQITAIDIAPGMIETAKSKIKSNNIKFIVEDGEALPFEKQEFDLVVSNASLQWMDNEKVFSEVSRVLKPNSNFYFTTFGASTLKEARDLGLSVNEFKDENELLMLLNKYFKNPIIEKKKEIIGYKDIFDLFAYLKNIGAQTPTKKQNKGLLTKNRLTAISNAPLKITWEIYVGSAVK